MALAVVLLVLVVLISITFSVATSSVQCLNMSLADQSGETARYAAEAGVNDAYAQILSNPQWNTGFTAKALPSGTATYTVTVVNNYGGDSAVLASDGTVVPPHDIYLMSTGFADSLKRSTSVMLEASGGGTNPFGLGVFANSSDTLSGGYTINSYNSALGFYGSSNSSAAAPVGSNAALAIGGSTR